MDIGYPWHCGKWLFLSMLIEVVTLRADDRREAEDTYVLQKWWFDVVNTALKWPTHRYINHRGYRSPDDGSSPEVMEQLAYYATPYKLSCLKPYKRRETLPSRGAAEHTINLWALRREQ